MSQKLTEPDWKRLLRRIKTGDCLPFLGAGAAGGKIPVASDIARRWADEHDYPLADRTDLARVAQFVAVSQDAITPKEDLVAEFTNLSHPDFSRDDEPHGALARLPLPVYMTTNYDDFMYRALEHEQKDPRREICRWNSKLMREQPSHFDDTVPWEPTPANPVVYHLHGHTEIKESLVLTEDDYLDFLVRLSRDNSTNPQWTPQASGDDPREVAMLAPVIAKALTGCSLLFIGYSLRDWDFRVLFRGLVAAMEDSLRYLSVSVQLLPEDTPDDVRPAAEEYLDSYFGKMNVRVYWGNAQDFAAEISRRWRDFNQP